MYHEWRLSCYFGPKSLTTDRNNVNKIELKCDFRIICWSITYLVSNRVRRGVSKCWSGQGFANRCKIWNLLSKLNNLVKCHWKSIKSPYHIWRGENDNLLTQKSLFWENHCFAFLLIKNWVFKIPFSGLLYIIKHFRKF